MRLIPLLVILIAALLTVARPGAGQSDPRLATADVLSRAAKYVTEFEGRLAGVVAEEHYRRFRVSTQETIKKPGGRR